MTYITTVKVLGSSNNNNSRAQAMTTHRQRGSQVLPFKLGEDNKVKKIIIIEIKLMSPHVQILLVEQAMGW